MSGKSITKRMFIGIVGVVIGFSVLVLAANTLLLKPLYYNRIKNSMIESISSYSDVDFSASRELWIDSIFILNAGKPYDIVVESGSRVIFSSSTDVGIKERPQEDFISDPQDSFPADLHLSKPPGPENDWRTVSEWTEADDSIYIGGFTDERSGQEFMVCRTQFDEPITIYLMQPIQPISDSISQANILLIICTIIVLILSIIFALRFSRRF
ncbi:MAG: hypothetical protein R3232_09515, partial [Clostridia bacterium]|nr:hypothetical protein [Clostridia bacterium]